MSYTPDIDDTATSREARSDGWTTERQLAFFEHLAEHGHVARAAEAVGMSPSSAYRLRGRAGADAFGFGWRAATAMAYYRVRDIALERVEHGVTMPQLYRGEAVATKTVFSDRLLMSLLNHLKPEAGAPAADGAHRPLPDPGIAYAAAVDAFAAAIETGDAPVVPCVDDGCGPGNGPTHAELRARHLRHQARAALWLDVVGEEITNADLDDEASMAELDAALPAMMAS